jgi:hypothetical protein
MQQGKEFRNREQIKTEATGTTQLMSSSRIANISKECPYPGSIALQLD